MKLLTIAICLIPAVAHAEWKTDTKVSQLDGNRTDAAAIDSVNSMPNAIGALDNATLIIRCTDGELETYVVWPAFMGLRAAEVKWKFDSGGVYKNVWSTSTNGTATFVRSADLVDFVHLIRTSSRLIVDATPYQSAAIEAVFDLTGAQSALPTLPTGDGEVCKKAK